MTSAAIALRFLYRRGKLWDPKQVALQADHSPHSPGKQEGGTW